MKTKEKTIKNNKIKVEDIRVKGITLIALVVTIVLLLILAGVTIVLIFNDDGIFGIAKEASLKTKIGELEDKVGVIYSNLVSKKYAENSNKEITTEDIIKELQNEGYDIVEVENVVTGISVENDNIILEPEETIEIHIEFERSSNTTQYYAIIEERNYKIILMNGKISIENEPSKINGTKAILTAASSNNNILVNVPNENGDIVTVTAVKEGTATIDIKYGEDEKEENTITCKVNIEKPSITAETIANANNKEDYYGKTVSGYTCTNSTGVENWRIFYAGSDFSIDNKSRIYLIANDYIPRDKIPNSANGNAVTVGTSYTRTASFSNILKDYLGSDNIMDQKIKKLNNSYFSQEYSSTLNNMKSVAYMLDTEIWKVYRDDNKAEYAIGGPTIEMFMKSYSQKHNVDFQARAKSNEGYEISQDGGKSWSNGIRSMITSDDLYSLSTRNFADAMWLASPSAGDSAYIEGIGRSGWCGYYSISNGAIGFRPLVCLNENTKLEQLSDGNFKIK